ncbi:MAG: hypothetical protein ACP5E4_03630, partial [Candidatus Aenigmatarchaeota archaeon]
MGVKYKGVALRKLAKGRRDSLSNYAGFKDISDEQWRIIDEKCKYVTPISNTACNLNSKIVFVLQDWASENHLLNLKKKGRLEELANLGYNSVLPSNKNFDWLLKETFGLKRKGVYMTNLFKYIKPGNMRGVKGISEFLGKAYND